MSAPATEQAVPAVKNFAFHEELVRATVRDDDPWFVGVDVCRVLGLQNPNRAMAKLDASDRADLTIRYPSGSKTLIIISLAGAFDLILVSRMPNAREIKRWLTHEVLPALYKNGTYTMADARSGLPPLEGAARAEIPEGFLAKLYCVRECRFIHGAAVARLMWNKLGLPPVPPPPLTAQDEARQCLRHLLDAPVHAEGPAIRDCLEDALEEDEEARALLLGAGIRVYADRDGFVVANQGPWLREVFHGTEWAVSYARVLRRLPGTAAAGTSRFKGINRRGTFLPADLLDEG